MNSLLTITLTATLLLTACFQSASAFVPFPSQRSASTILRSSSEKQSWDAFRFLRQSSRFINLPFVPRSSNLTRENVRPGDILWQVESDTAFTMSPLDDVVMGGVSSSTFDNGQWKGVVTDANNGGFVGIRSTPSFKWNMKDCKGLQWTLVQNSKRRLRFKFVNRDSTDFNGITWTTSVDLKPGKNVVKIDFSKQIPALFAKTVPDQTFQADNVVAVQIAYSKFEYDGDLNPNFELGPVDLQLIELKAF